MAALDLLDRAARAGADLAVMPEYLDYVGTDEGAVAAAEPFPGHELDPPFALWSRAAVRELTWRRFGARLAVRTMGTYPARWGYTAQKPLRRAYKLRILAECDEPGAQVSAVAARYGI